LRSRALKWSRSGGSRRRDFSIFSESDITDKKGKKRET
jgi:hypothetical protein